MDKELYFRVIGYHPYRDSLVIGTDFIDRNLEYEEQFLTVIEQGLPKKKDTPAPDEKDTPKPGGDVIDGQAEPDSTTDSLLVMSFRNEMVLFYNQKKNASSISIDFIESCIAFINEKILVEFGINLATPEAILEKGRDMLSGVEHEEVLLANLEEGVSFYQRILSYNTIAYFPVQVENADITKVTFQRYQNGKPMHPKPYVYKFFNGGGFKIDFSTGIIKHGLIDDRFKLSPIEITDTTYSVQNPSIIEKINTKTQGRIMQEKSSKFNISLGLLAHFYTRRMAGLNRFNLGLSTGVLLDKKDEDFQLKYLFGGSLLFGSERRWVLSGGAILGKVARLAEGLETGEKGSLLPYTPNTTNEVPTRDIFEYGWFVGVTYNLGKKKTE